MKQKFLLMLAVFGIIFVSGCIQERDTVKPEIPSGTNLSVCDLLNAPNQYVNETIEIEATLRFIGENYWSGNRNFFLENIQEDKVCQIPVTPWLPVTVAHCSPEARDRGCKEPPTIGDFLDQKLSLTGVLREFPESPQGTYVITDVKNVSKQ